MSEESFPNRAEDDAPKDPQQRYDENLSNYTTGDPANLKDDRPERYTKRFPTDFYEYSQDFHDREDGAPGIDQDYAIDTGQPRRDAANREGISSDSRTDGRIREEIMALLSQDEDIGADDVSARVEEGLVTLSGNVDRARAKFRIEENVQSIPGVEEVVNCILVNPRRDLN